jgi:hypothetical protein
VATVSPMDRFGSLSLTEVNPSTPILDATRRPPLSPANAMVIVARQECERIAIVAALPAFATVRNAVFAIQGGPLVSLTVSMNVLAG